MKRFISFYFVCGVLPLAVVVLGISPAWPSDELESDRDGFDWALIDDATPQPNGMMEIRYHDPTNRFFIDHATLHRVLRVTPGSHSALAADDSKQYTLIEMEGALVSWVYWIFREPLFYGNDLDSAGFPQQLWIDPEEDGINGNERRYLNPE